MKRTLIIADDLTGALDTAAPFAKKGAAVKVISGLNCSAAGNAQVTAVNTESRHLSPDEAYRRVYNVARGGLEQGYNYLYKKTDSALRGNIGAELSALLAASGQKTLYFAPAFPRLNRVTKNGIHYIDGIPVNESVLGRDPFEPVNFSYVPDIIGQQSGIPAMTSFAGGQAISDTAPKILVFDAWEQSHLVSVIDLLPQNQVVALAGCAGLAQSLADALIDEGAPVRYPAKSQIKKGVLVFSGSVNPITLTQLQYAQHAGYTGLTLSPEQKLRCTEQTQAEVLEKISKICNRNKICLLTVQAALTMADVDETNAFAAELGIEPGTLREQISGNLGAFARAMLRRLHGLIFLFVGGDTLISAIERIGWTCMTPIDEILPGVILSEIIWPGDPLYIISKSGGFCNAEVLTELAAELTRKGFLALQNAIR